MRKLYLVCYDISDPKCLAKVRKAVQNFSIDGQKSFYECWLTHFELSELIYEFTQLIDFTRDRVHIFQLDPRLSAQFLSGSTTRQNPLCFLMV